MKISRLYLKILLAFIAVQLLVVLFIGALVHMGKIRPPFIRLAEERVSLVKHMLMRDLGGSSEITPIIQTRLHTTLNVLADAFKGHAWLTDERGVTITKSFEGAIPLTGEEEIEHKQITSAGDMVYLLEHDDHDDDSERRVIYVVGAVPMGDTGLSIHLLKKWHKRNEELWLMKGLILMGVLSALLLIPVSRRVSRPLNELTESAEHISRGDFSPRVETCRNDEVGKLAHTFNHMADSLEKMIRGGRELTANLSHELRSPLARIRISQQIMQERLESGRTDGMDKHLTKMTSEIEHMDSLIDKILRLSKLDLQEPQPREDDMDICDGLHQAVDRHQPLIRSKSISIDMQTSPMSPFRCREEDLRIAVDNVLANAVKYSPEGATIKVECGKDEDGQFIRVANPYRDLANEELESIFVPFKRLGYDNVEGNGLGLAFARKIVEEHGGTLMPSCESGTFVMTIRLPLEQE